MGDAVQSALHSIRKPRKSRGRGLRTTTGCLVCKRRHVKCDEGRPQCGPCAKGQRPCVYNAAGNNTDTSIQPSEAPPLLLGQCSESSTAPQLAADGPLQTLVDACDRESLTQQHQSSRKDLNTTPHSIQASSSLPSLPVVLNRTVSSSASPQRYGPSPAADSSAISAKGAPLSWFELLASDAAHAARGFFLPSPQRVSSGAAAEQPTGSRHDLSPLSHSQRESESIQAASFQHDFEAERNLPPTSEAPSVTLPDEPSSWNTATDIGLSAQERRMFHHFIRNLGPVIDFFDAMRHFSIAVPHLALRNVGLMKALLSVSARHLSLHVDFSKKAPEGDTGTVSCLPIDRSVAVEYYYETLHYLNQAMRYPSYTLSQELIATATLISTYEMIDGSNRDWERHLKGVFWIQRYQDNDGESGGLGQAVWWAWLRQDVWVALRERRRVFTAWQPKKHISMLSAPELTSRMIYLLAQCVNYASREELETTDLQQRLEQGNTLLYKLQEWYDYLPRGFNPLPTIQDSAIFPPICVYPPSYAGALQMHSLARVLVVLNRPPVGGLEDYRAARRLLTASVNTICGLARTIDADDTGASLAALPCLFVAGMSIESPRERAVLLDLLETFQERLHWPENSLREELETEYRKADKPTSAE